MWWFLMASVASAWGWEGHGHVGRIAYDLLRPETQVRVDELLDLVGEEDLGTASQWADRVRAHAVYKDHGPDHYVNVEKEVSEQELYGICGDKPCILRAIREHAQTLSSPSASQLDRANALRWLGHLVGDIHQPLHVGRASDRGGNSITVRSRGLRRSLHGYWDYVIFEQDSRSPEEAAERLKQIRPQDLREWSYELRPEAWAEESLQIAQRFAYNVQDGKITAAYRDRAEDYAYSRVQAASVRLAHAIEVLLSSPQQDGPGIAVQPGQQPDPKSQDAPDAGQVDPESAGREEDGASQEE